MPNRQLDAYDRRILEALQKNGRLTNVELAEQIGLSPSPCLRRVRMLEEAGVIQGYEARLDPHEVGLGLTVFVGVKVERHHERDAELFRQEVSALPEVIAAHLVSGESDFLLQVVVPDLRGYEHFLLHTDLAPREAKENAECSRDYKSCVRANKDSSSYTASTQRKEVIRCLMVQQGGRKGVFVSPKS